MQSIISAAEASAAEIRDEAEKQARATAEISERHAEQTRTGATRQAEEYVAKVREATADMLERQQRIQAELDALQEAVRSKGEQIDRELAELTRGLNVLTTGLGEISAESSTWRTDESGKTLRSKSEDFVHPDREAQVDETYSKVKQS